MKNVNAFELTKNKKLFLLDMDGTVYHGDVPIPGATDFIKSLCRTGADYIFMTNNSSKSADAYLEKLHRLGFPAEKKNILTSGPAEADSSMTTPITSASVIKITGEYSAS